MNSFIFDIFKYLNQIHFTTLFKFQISKNNNSNFNSSLSNHRSLLYILAILPRIPLHARTNTRSSYSCDLSSIFANNSSRSINTWISNFTVLSAVTSQTFAATDSCSSNHLASVLAGLPVVWFCAGESKLAWDSCVTCVALALAVALSTDEFSKVTALGKFIYGAFINILTNWTTITSRTITRTTSPNPNNRSSILTFSHIMILKTGDKALTVVPKVSISAVAWAASSFPSWGSSILAGKLVGASIAVERSFAVWTVVTCLTNAGASSCLAYCYSSIEALNSIRPILASISLLTFITAIPKWTLTNTMAERASCFSSIHALNPVDPTLAAGH